jgi:NADH-quinone oxidoreductase subunit C
LSSNETADAGTEAAEAVETDEVREGLVQAFRDELGDAVVGSHVDPGVDVWVRVTADAWIAAAEFARDRLGCTYFDFLSAIDWMPSPYGRDMDAQEDLVTGADGAEPLDGADEAASVMEQGVAGGETRFQLLARVHSPAEGHGVFLKCDLDGDPPSAPTWVPVFAGADWHERETAEMFGIDFVGHPNLVKLYLPGAFEGHPLRKDFPLLSRRVKPWPGIVDVEQMPGEDDDGAGGDVGGADGSGS